MNIGLLTAGGDCPGLNAAIRAVVRASEKKGYNVIGIKEGWKGLVNAEAMPLTRDKVSGLLFRGGTILGSTPSSVFHKDIIMERLIEGYKKLGLDALIVIGGDSTLGLAAKMGQAGLNVVGIPKTIDNDLVGTERTIGFNTAVTVATEAIDRVHSTAESHHRVMIVEVMGREAGWIAVVSGIAGGADMILVPEKPFDIEKVCKTIKKRHETKNFTIVVVAEGAYPAGGAVTTTGDIDAFGYKTLGGIAYWLKGEINKRLGFDTRAVILGHTQRGGTPTVEDRVLATRFGVEAVNLVSQGKFGNMVAIQDDQIVNVQLTEAVKQRTVTDYWYDLAEIFFG